jgi:hypothetical protein
MQNEMAIYLMIIIAEYLFAVFPSNEEKPFMRKSERFGLASNFTSISENFEKNYVFALDKASLNFDSSPESGMAKDLRIDLDSTKTFCFALNIVSEAFVPVQTAAISACNA